MIYFTFEPLPFWKLTEKWLVNKFRTDICKVVCVKLWYVWWHEYQKQRDFKGLISNISKEIRELAWNRVSTQTRHRLIPRRLDNVPLPAAEGAPYLATD